MRIWHLFFLPFSAIVYLPVLWADIFSPKKRGVVWWLVFSFWLILTLSIPLGFIIFGVDKEYFEPDGLP